MPRIHHLNLCHPQSPLYLWNELLAVGGICGSELITSQKIRSPKKVQAVARSIAKLEGSDTVAEHHIAEAIQYSFRACGAFRSFVPPETVEVKG